MSTDLRSIFLSFTLAVSAAAGELNVVHLSPDKDINFEVKAGSTSQKFTLAYQSSSGPFILPEKKAVLRTLGDATKPLNIPPLKSGRLAILFPSSKGPAWKLDPAAPTPGKNSLRIINLAEEPAQLLIAGEKLTAPASSTTSIQPSPKGQVRITIVGSGSKPSTHDRPEPGAVAACLYKVDGQWNIHFVNDG